jgi:hypothetical protein
MGISRGRKFYLAALIVTAVLGSVLFFPMNIGGRYTCFYHRIFEASHPVFGANVPAHAHSRVQNYSEPNKNHNNGKEEMNTSLHDSPLLDAYLNSYAFIWWGSVGVLAFCLYIFFKLRRKLKLDNSSLTLK